MLSSDLSLRYDVILGMVFYKHTTWFRDHAEVRYLKIAKWNDVELSIVGVITICMTFKRGSMRKSYVLNCMVGMLVCSDE